MQLCWREFESRPWLLVVGKINSSSAICWTRKLPHCLWIWREKTLGPQPTCLYCSHNFDSAEGVLRHEEGRSNKGLRQTMVSLFFLFLRSEFDHAIHCIHLLGKAYAQVEWDKTIWTSLDSNLVRSIRKRVMVWPHGLVRVILLTQKRSSSVILISLIVVRSYSFWISSRKKWSVVESTWLPSSNNWKPVYKVMRGWERPAGWNKRWKTVNWESWLFLSYPR